MTNANETLAMNEAAANAASEMVEGLLRDAAEELEGIDTLLERSPTYALLRGESGRGARLLRGMAGRLEKKRTEPLKSIGG